MGYFLNLCDSCLEQYHPDMNKGPGAEEKFKEISAAYEVTFWTLLSQVKELHFLPIFVQSLELELLFVN